jgi:hypothetical protein
MTILIQRGPEGAQSVAHRLSRRIPQYQVFALPRFSTNVGESKEVKRLWSPLPARHGP